MANSQPSGADGDGTVSLNNSKWTTISTSSPWTDLPLPVCSVLRRTMNISDLRSLRLVCSKWRSIVEQHVSLKVYVNDTVSGGYLDFVRRVRIEKAQIINWTEDIGTEPASLLFQYPEQLRKLELCGKMPAKWKIHNLRQFPNLAYLTLGDRALSCNNLTGHQYPVYVFDPASPLSLEDTLQQAYKTQMPPTEAEPIELKSLQMLEIGSYEFDHDETSILRSHSHLVMKTNTDFIWNHIKAPLLSVAHIRTWTGSVAALNKFLENHRTSLRHLYLPSNFPSADEINENECLSFSMNLSRLELSIKATDQPTCVYLQKFLDAQTQLDEVYLDFGYHPSKWVADAFTAFVNTCANTLRYIELRVLPDRRSGVLDLQVLSVCRSLEVLHMPRPGHGSFMFTFKNLEKLHISMKRLIIGEGKEGNRVELGDPSIFKRFTGLEWLQLGGIHFDTANQSGNHHKFCSTMFRDLLSLRKLEGFHLAGPEMVMNRNRSLVKMLGPFDERINPAKRTPQSSVKFNFNWNRQTGEPFSDRPFAQFAGTT